VKGPNGGGVLSTLFLYEIKMLLRDTRTILITVVAPLVVFPIYILVLNLVEEREEEALQEATYTYAVIGSRASWAEELVDAAVRLEASRDDSTRAPVRFERKLVVDPEAALEAGDLHLVVEGLSVEEWDSIRAEEDDGAVAEESGGEGMGSSGSGKTGEEYAAAEEEDMERPMVPALRILFRAESDFSSEARERLTNNLLDVRRARRDTAYRAAGFPVTVENVASFSSESVATPAKEAGGFLGIALTPFLVLLMLSGGSIVAVDAISGEKERGTLETLLTSAADRRDIVRAKLLAVIVVGLAVSVINVANLLAYLVLGLIDLPASLAVQVNVFQLLLLLGLFVPVAVLIGSALLLLSGAAKSFKEYQIYFYPVFVAFTVPSFAAALPGVELRSAIAVVPLAGIAVAVREILQGKVDLPFIALAIISTGGLGLWLAHLTQENLSNEKLISGSDLDEADLKGGAALFPRHVIRWFLALWVVFFVVSLWFGERLGIQGQILVNLVGIFFGGSLVMIGRYRLDPIRAFSLRMPHPAAWLAVLMGAPAALIVGVGLAELVNTYIFPVPQELLESFGQSLVEPEMALWQIILFLAVMPGIFEELAFRGILLHGLRDRIRRPWLLALAVGAVFGLFHVSLFRIVPTGFLGFVLTWVVLLGGSIYPAMLWHGLNNAIAIVPDRLGWVSEDFSPEGWWVVPAGVVLLLSLWILKKTGPRGGKGSVRAEGGLAGPRPGGPRSPGARPVDSSPSVVQSVETPSSGSGEDT